MQVVVLRTHSNAVSKLPPSRKVCGPRYTHGPPKGAVRLLVQNYACPQLVGHCSADTVASKGGYRCVERCTCVHTGWSLHHWWFWTSQSRVWSLTMYIEACHVSPASNTQRLESQTCQSVPVCSRPPRPAPTNMRGCWQHSWWLIFHTTPYLSTILANMSGCAVFYSNVAISR